MADDRVEVRITGDVSDAVKEIEKLRGTFDGLRQRLDQLKEATSAGAAFSGLQAKLVTFGAAISGVRAAVDLASGAIRGAINAAQAFTEAASVQEEATLKLRTALASINEENAELVGSLARQATAFQDSSRFGDELVTAVQAQLVQIGLLPAELERATAAAIDFAQATGRDLPAAAEAIGRAAQGNVRAFQQLGISLVDTGSRTQNLRNAIDALNARFGGAGAAAVANYVGRITQLQGTFGDLLESIGFIVTKNADLVGTFGEIRETLKNVAAIVDRNRESFSDLFGAAFNVAIDLTILMAEAFVKLGRAAAGAFAVLSLGNQAFVDLTIALKDVDDEIDTLQGSLLRLRARNQLGLTEDLRAANVATDELATSAEAAGLAYTRAFERAKGAGATVGEALSAGVAAAAAAAASQASRITGAIDQVGRAAEVAGSKLSGIFPEDISAKTKSQLEEVNRAFDATIAGIEARAAALGPDLFTPLDAATQRVDAARTALVAYRQELGAGATAMPQYAVLLGEIERAGADLKAAKIQEGITRVNEELAKLTTENATAGLSALDAAIAQSQAKLVELADSFGVTRAEIEPELDALEASVRQAFSAEFAAGFNEQMQGLDIEATATRMGGLAGEVFKFGEETRIAAEKAGLSMGEIVAAVDTAKEKLTTKIQATAFSGIAEEIEGIREQAAQLGFAGPIAELDQFNARIDLMVEGMQLGTEQADELKASFAGAFAELQEGRGRQIFVDLAESSRTAGEAFRNAIALAGSEAERVQARIAQIQAEIQAREQAIQALIQQGATADDPRVAKLRSEVQSLTADTREAQSELEGLGDSAEAGSNKGAAAIEKLREKVGSLLGDLEDPGTTGRTLSIGADVDALRLELEKLKVAGDPKGLQIFSLELKHLADQLPKTGSAGNPFERFLIQNSIAVRNLAELADAAAAAIARMGESMKGLPPAIDIPVRATGSPTKPFTEYFDDHVPRTVELALGRIDDGITIPVAVGADDSILRGAVPGGMVRGGGTGAERIVDRSSAETNELLRDIADTNRTAAEASALTAAEIGGRGFTSRQITKIEQETRRRGNRTFVLGS